MRNLILVCLVFISSLSFGTTHKKPLQPPVAPPIPRVMPTVQPQPPTQTRILPTALNKQNSLEIKRYYAVPLKDLQFFNLQNRPVVEAQQFNLGIVQLTQLQVTELTTKLHAIYHSCGGFSDLTVLMQLYGVSPMQALTMTVKSAPMITAFDKLEPTYPTEAKKVVSLLDANRMWKFLSELSSFPNRSALSPEGVKAAQWLGDRSAKLAADQGRADVQVLKFPTGGQYVQPSVAVRIVGADSKLPGVLIGAHMDTFDKVMPGSDDDGSGTATVMEVFNGILDSGIKFKRDIYFAYYAAEERGLVGSKVMVAEFRKRGIPLRSVLQMDMTGFKSPKDAAEIFMITDHVNPELTKFVAKLATVYAGVPAQKVGATECGYSCSDHASWTSGGYDSTFPFEASFGNDNPTIHTPNDKMDIMNQAHAAAFMRLSGAYIVETADPLSR